MNLFRNSLTAVALVALAVLLCAPVAEASRSGLPAAYEPALDAPATPDQVLEAALSDPPERLRLFEDLRLPERPLELVEARKTASGPSTFGLGLNVSQTGGLGWNCGGLSFQGLWTDPVTGISYARNRWYDARTASWLSEDPMGAVDSPNLYAFVGWGPHVNTDPMGLRMPTEHDNRMRRRIANDITQFDTAWAESGTATATVINTTARANYLTLETEYVAIAESLTATNEEEYRRIRGRLVAELRDFDAAVVEADRDDVIEHPGGGAWGRGPYYTVFTKIDAVALRQSMDIINAAGTPQAAANILYVAQRILPSHQAATAPQQAHEALGAEDGINEGDVAFGLTRDERERLVRHRPSRYRRGVVEEVWENAQDDEGRVFDPNTGEELFWDRSTNRNDQWDMGHRRGQSYDQLRQQFLDGEISRKEYLDKYHDPESYQPEAPSPNRGRRFD